MNTSLRRSLLAVFFLSFGATQAAELRLEPGTVKPGDPLLVTVLGIEDEPTGTAGTRELKFYEVPGGYQAITGLPVELQPGTLKVKISANEAVAARDDKAVQLEASGEVVEPDPAVKPLELEGTVDVIDPQFRKSELRVASKYVSPPAKVRRWIKEDQQAFNKAQSQAFGPPLFKQDFAWPRHTEITAPFGDLRLFNGKKQSQHFGVDLDGNTGDPIEAANDGTVVLVRECYASGNTVIVHHGAGLYTLYFHMSHFDVKEGDPVKQGQLLGLVGKTGRVTGPHLHWSVKIDGLYVDGQSLLKLRFKR